MSEALVFGFTEVVLAGEAEGLHEILILPAGQTETRKGSFLVDDQSWSFVDGSFKARGGNHLVIDWEHQSIGGPFSRSDGLAPAAGWIHSLRYEPEKGIIATVEWTDRARDAIRAREYRYISPAFRRDKATGRVVELLSIGLTNTPAMPGVAALAASARFSIGVRDMPKSKVPERSTPKGLDLLGDAAWVTLRDSTPEEQAMAVEQAVGEIDEIGALIADLKLKLALPDDTGPTDVLRRCMERIGGGEAKPEASAFTALRDRLGLKSDDGADVIVAAVDRLMATTVNAEQYAALSAKVTALEADKAKARAESLVVDMVNAGKLNPRDDKRMVWALKQATERPDDWLTLMAEAPVIMPPDGQVATGTAGTGKRAAIIGKALKDYDGERIRPKSKVPYVNVVLSEQDEAALTDEEVATLAIK